VADLWTWCNGYALCTQQGLELIADYLRTLNPRQIDALAGKLRVGIHRDVEVTDAPSTPGPLVSQAFSRLTQKRFGQDVLPRGAAARASLFA
jgi:hypothetical protein